VRALLSEGADVNLKSVDPGLAGGRTPLVAASRQGYYEAGADVHKDGEKDGEGEDALMLASSRGHACCTGVALQGSLSASKRQSRQYGAYFGCKRRYGSLIARSGG